MKFVIVLCICSLAVVLAGPVSSPSKTPPAALLKHEEVHNEDGYTVEFELDDGTQVKERAVKVVTEDGAVFYRRVGFYRYQSPEGENIEEHYTADENGFIATGNHLPTPVQA